MAETATRSKDTQVVKALRDRVAVTETLRKRSAGLADVSEEAVKQNNIFFLDWAKTQHIGWAEATAHGQIDLDLLFWIPMCSNAVAVMECKSVRLNHVVFKARFSQDKSQKRSFQEFSDPQVRTLAVAF